MRIYLAARYSRREELCRYAEELREVGHIVDARWLLGEHQVHDGALEVEAAEDDVPDEDVLFAREDIEDIDRADVVICFTEKPRSNSSRGGRHVEFGYALAMGKPIVVIGPRENVFYTLPQVEQYGNWLLFKAERWPKMFAAHG